MTISSRHSEVARYQKLLADLQKKLADESKKEASKADQVSRIERSVSRSTSVSTLRTKQQQIVALISDIADIQKKKAEISKKIADANTKLHRSQERLRKEEDRERKQIDLAEKKREMEQLSHQKAITQELRSQYSFKGAASQTEPRFVEYDAFVSHASEDKENFVKPLVHALQSAGYKVWYDEFTLKVGDSLRRSIDSGLKNSRYGIVIFSGAFFKKN